MSFKTENPIDGSKYTQYMSHIFISYFYDIFRLYTQFMTEAIGSVRAGQGDVRKSKAKEAEVWKNR